MCDSEPSGRRAERRDPEWRAIAITLLIRWLSVRYSQLMWRCAEWWRVSTLGESLSGYQAARCGIRVSEAVVWAGGPTKTRKEHAGEAEVIGSSREAHVLDRSLCFDRSRTPAALDQRPQVSTSFHPTYSTRPHWPMGAPESWVLTPTASPLCTGKRWDNGDQKHASWGLLSRCYSPVLKSRPNPRPGSSVLC